MNLDRLNLSRRGDAQTRTDERSAAGRTGPLRATAADTPTSRIPADRAARDRPVSGRTDAGLDRPDPRPGDPARTTVMNRRAVVARQREAFGGVKIGSAFFGWLTATGSAVLLTALVAASGTAVGVLNGGSVSHPDVGVTWRGARGAVIVILILFAAYFCGGYVAGRMARFNGLKQGVAVFGWAVLVMLLVAALGAVAGTQWDALNAVTGIPRFSTGPARVTTDGLLVGLLAGAAALIGAVLGGMSGMLFHRRVDRASLGA
jgi:hypothetical protein